MATTSPYRNIDRDFDIVEVAKAAGASFVARTTTSHAQQATSILKQAIAHDGFAVVEILSPCTTHFSRKNREGDAMEMMERLKKMTCPVGSQAKQKDPDLIERGIFVQADVPEYTREYDRIIERAMKG